MLRHKFLSTVLLLSQQKCLMSRHQTCLHPASHGLVLLEYVATQIFLVATNNCFSAWQLCRDREDFFKSLAIFCRDKKLCGRDKLFFSGSCHLLSCLSRHRIICCDTIALTILKYSSISVATYFSLIATEFYHSFAFIVAT